ncbi:proline racemase family protein [Bifidobacterium aquikefiricola]|uniref:Proline racemase family protein n=1 Tax=Bifidobacterium aquikefiricola TaxID=3059038 RepID=A0AB39U5P6_9BIFI
MNTTAQTGSNASVDNDFWERSDAAVRRLQSCDVYRERAIIRTVESHTQGEPTRIVVSGLQGLHGTNAIAVMQQLEHHYDGLRRLLMLEPRGHRNMFGAFVFPPTRADADLGVVFSHSRGFATMCGHGSIGVATFAVESGLVTGEYGSFEEIHHDDIDVRLDTPAGLVVAQVHVRDGRVANVTLTNVPAFVAQQHVVLKLPDADLPEVDATIAFGGNFFALVDADKIGLDLEARNSPKVMDLGMEILHAAQQQCDVTHPLVDISGVNFVEFGSARGANRQYRNGVVFGDRQIDRSPCGTGTSAKLATLLSRGKIAVGEQAAFSSITGSQFIGKVQRTTQIGPYDGVIPQITGQAFTTGFSTFVLDPDDIYPNGFLV